MREAVSLRLIDRTIIRRITGQLTVAMLLASFLLTGLPDCLPVEVAPAAARTVKHSRARAPVARRKSASRSKRVRARRPSRIRSARAPAPRRKAAKQNPGKTAVKPAAVNKAAVKPAPANKAAVKPTSNRTTALDNGSTEAQPVDKRVVMARIYALRDLGLNEHLSGNHGAAVRRLMEATQLSSTYHGKPSATESLLFSDLAACAEQAGLTSVAREAYAQWLDRSPRSSEARIRLSGLLARQGQVSEATRIARRAIELDPASPRAHLLLALLLEHQGELTEARAERDASRALLESRPQARKPEPEVKVTEVETGDFTPAGPENLEEIPVGLP